jgi:hypothetical protein
LSFSNSCTVSEPGIQAKKSGNSLGETTTINAIEAEDSQAPIQAAIFQRTGKRQKSFLKT